MAGPPGSVEVATLPRRHLVQEIRIPPVEVDGLDGGILVLVVPLYVEDGLNALEDVAVPMSDHLVGQRVLPVALGDYMLHDRMLVLEVILVADFAIVCRPVVLGRHAIFCSLFRGERGFPDLAQVALVVLHGVHVPPCGLPEGVRNYFGQ